MQHHLAAAIAAIAEMQELLRKASTYIEGIEVRVAIMEEENGGRGESPGT